MTSRLLVGSWCRVRMLDILGLIDVGKTGEHIVLTGVVAVGWQGGIWEIGHHVLEGGH